jgi:hypothetical protein
LQDLPSEHQIKILAGQARAKGVIVGAMVDKRASDTTRECGQKLVDIFDRMPQDLASTAFWRRGDSPEFLSIYLWTTKCSQAGFKPIPKGPRLECIASLPRLCRTGTCGPVPGGPLEVGPQVSVVAERP